MSRWIKLTSIAGLVACSYLTVLMVFAGVAAACSGGGGGGGGGCPAPSVSTGSATSISSNSVTLNGSVNPQGCVTTYTFEYGRTSESGYPDSITSSAGSGTSTVSVSTSSAIVQPSTSYRFRLSASNSGGTAFGDTSYFTTKAACAKPTVTTEAASSVTPYSATMNGTVNAGGCETMYKFEWGPSSSPSTYPYLETGYVGGSSTIRVSKPATALEPGRSYHFRISATNPGGAATPGADKTFTATPLTDYVALGDSYSSGTGTRTFIEPACRKSVHSYPWLLHNAHPEWIFFNRTCHGAETSNVINDQTTVLNEHTKWVTYTIGGNDAHFRPVLEACGTPWVPPASCENEIYIARQIILNELPHKLDTVNSKIKAQAKYAKVVALNYPRIFNGTDCNWFTTFRSADMAKMNELADLMRGVISAAATRAGPNFFHRDVIPSFIGQAVCDGGEGSATEWINGYSDPIEESYHPKIAGQHAYYTIVRGVTG